MSIQQGNYDVAERYIDKGLQITKEQIVMLEKTGELIKDTEDKFGFQFMLGLAFRYLGILYSRREQYSEANKFFSESLLVFENLQRKSIIANQKIEMAELALKAGNITEANKLYDEAIGYHFRQQEAKPWVLPWIARAYYGQGDIKLREKKFSEAKKIYLKSLGFATARGSESEIAHVKYRLALIDETDENYRNATENAEEALKIFVRLGNMDFIGKCEDLITRLRHHNP